MDEPALYPLWVIFFLLLLAVEKTSFLKYKQWNNMFSSIHLFSLLLKITHLKVIE